MIGDDAGDSVRGKVGQDRGHRRFHDERDQKEEGEDGEYGRDAQAEGGVEFSLLHQCHHLHHRQHPAYGARLGVLFLGAHDHRRLVGINDCSVVRGRFDDPSPLKLVKNFVLLSPLDHDDRYGYCIDPCFHGNFYLFRGSFPFCLLLAWNSNRHALLSFFFFLPPL